MSDHDSISEMRGVRKSARVSRKPRPQVYDDIMNYSEGEDSDSQLSADFDDDDDDDFDASTDSSPERDSDDDEAFEGVNDDLDLGDTKSIRRSSSRRSGTQQLDESTLIKHQEAEKAKRLPEFRNAAWLLAHPPRKATKNGNTMERSWMNRRLPFAFKNRDTRLRTTGGIELFATRATRDPPGVTVSKNTNANKKYGDWSKPEHGQNVLNLHPDYLKFLWDDGIPGESSSEPLAMESRQLIRCDENFGPHAHENNDADPAGFICCESRESHLNLYLRKRREELERESQQEEAKDDFEGEEAKSKKKRCSKSRWSARRPNITDKVVFEEVHAWEDHDYAICTACDGRQLQHLTADAEDGHLFGALLPLCGGCSVNAVDTYGFGYNGCSCDKSHRCLDHRIEHLEGLKKAREEYVRAHQPQLGDDIERTPVCPHCKKNFPPPVPRHFAYNCRECDKDIVIPAPEDLEERWQNASGQPQNFVQELGRPVERSLALLNQEWEWNGLWVLYFKRYAANPLLRVSGESRVVEMDWE